MITTILKIQHAQAVRTKDRKGVLDTEKELAKHGVTARWLSNDILVWDDEKTSKRKRTATIKTEKKSDDQKFYAGIECKICKAPVEKTGRQGRPPTKCLIHR